MHQYSLVAAFRLYPQSPRESQKSISCQVPDFTFECLIRANSTENQNILKKLFIYSISKASERFTVISADTEKNYAQ